MRKERKIGEKIEAIDFFNVHNIFTYYFKKNWLGGDWGYGVS